MHGRAAATFVVLITLGCGHATPVVEAPPTPKRPTPEWVMHLPRKKGDVCAVGAVDPTYYRQDGLKFAAESARAELAKTIQVKVSSVMLDYQTTSGSSVDQATVEEVVGSVSDGVISGAEIVESWYDEEGQVSRRGMTYALACMKTDQSVADLAEKLKQVAPPSEDREKKIQDVRDRAAAAFDELDKESEKRDGAGK
ncbi:MAG: LPP20 family lipoprotein [Myxococcota bacterium]